MNKPFNEPLKILFKVKNNQGQYQQYNYIFVGNPSNKIKEILLKIKDLDLYNTLKQLTKEELETLENYYGKLWYKYFFTYEYLENHLAPDGPHYDYIKTKINIIEYETIKKNLTYRTFGNNYLADFNMHIMSTLLNKQYISDKTLKIVQQVSKDLDILGGSKNKLKNKKSVSKNTEKSSENANLNSEDEDETNIIQTNSNQDSETENNQNFNQELDADNEPDEDFDFNVEELTKEMEEDFQQEQQEQNYNDKQNEKDIDRLDKILDTDTTKDINKGMIKFDPKYDDTIYEYSPRHSYNKYYVFNQYIYKDDTIKVIKEKICCSILNKEKFSKNNAYNYIVPSRQYLWFYDKSNTAVPLGFIWKSLYTTLNYKYEPQQNIKLYENLEGFIKKYYNEFVVKKQRLIYENNTNKILEDYLKYMINEDIYMVDIYNELSIKHQRTQSQLENLKLTYIKIFFPDIQDILNYIDGSNPLVESNYINSIFTDITPNLILNQEIFDIVQEVSIKNSNQINKIITSNNIIQAKIIVKLQSKDVMNFNRLELFKIFNDFTLNNKYIFVQLTELNKKTVYKFNEKVINDIIQNSAINEINDNLTEENPDTLSFINEDAASTLKYKQIVNWFNKNKLGLTFKVWLDNKTYSIHISLTGDLYYKVHWKEDDHKGYEDIIKSYDLIKQIIKDINKTSITNKFTVPLDNDFETMFVSSIAEFKLPNDVIINHNVLSDFSRLFYPYFALVIEPRKRISQTHKSDQKVSKYGTYLRYKRISNYEDNKQIETQIKKYIQYYDATTTQIINMICKQFNITTESAQNYFNNVMKMYPNIKKKFKNLLKLNETTHYKTPGIDVSIQGKTPDKYKLRISGVKNQKISDNICNIIQVLLYLYYEIYLNKNKKLYWIKDILIKLNNIAERRSIVADIVNNEKETEQINVSVDKYRIGYKPYKNQSYYKRVCQNSGDKIRRQPQQFTDETIDKLLAEGYKKNKASGYYEKQVVLKDGRKKTLVAVELRAIDDNGKYTNNKIYYTCDPKYNGDHMYIGYLTKSNNPFGEKIPCCFKKEKQFWEDAPKQKQSAKQTLNEQFYILQDTVKLQEGRLGFLPQILDYFINTHNGKQAYIKDHILSLIESKDNKNNYYFKIGVDNTKSSFIASVAYCLGMTYNNVLMKCTNVLTGKNKDLIFNALNNGDLKLKFNDINRYLSVLKKSNLSVQYIIHLLSIPGVLLEEGLNILLFQKISSSQTQFKANYQLKYVNNEEITYIDDPRRKTLLICADNINYFPICSVKKIDTVNGDKKNIESKLEIKALFNKTDEIIGFVRDYYMNFNKFSLNEENYTAKELVKILKENGYGIENQVVDSKNKVRFITIRMRNNNKDIKYLLMPVIESGSLYNIDLVNIYNELNDKKIYGGINENKEINETNQEQNQYISKENVKKSDEEKYNNSNQKQNNYQINEMNGGSAYCDQLQNDLINDFNNNNAIYGGNNLNNDIDYNKVFNFDYQTDEDFEKENKLNLENNNSSIENKQNLYQSGGKNKKENNETSKSFDYYIQPLNITIDLLKLISKVKELNKYNVSKLQYDKIKDNKYRLIGVLLNNNLSIPIKKLYVNKDEYNYKLDKVPYYENIDKHILRNDIDQAIDERIKIISYNKFKTESYELFKYHISEYLTTKLKETIKDIIKSELDYDDKLDVLKGFFFKIINNKKLNDVYAKLKRHVKKENELLKNSYDLHKFYIYDDSDLPDLTKYKNENIRKLCNTKSKDQCNYQCKFVNNNCVFSLSYKTALLFVNKLSQELLNNDIKLKELLKEDGYYISSILNENYFVEKNNQKIIIRHPNDNSNPFINYYKSILPYVDDEPEQEEVIDDTYALKKFKSNYMQTIKSDKDGIIRAYANGMNWIINNKQAIENRNLGYSSLKQEKITNYLKSKIVDYLIEYNKNDETKKTTKNIQDFIIKLINDTNTVEDKKVLEILYKIHKIPIILYDEFNNEVYKAGDKDKDKTIIIKYSNNTYSSIYY